MMASSIWICGLFGLLLAVAKADDSEKRHGHGVIGYGITMYDPPCAFACRDTTQGWMLDCADTDSGGGHEMTVMKRMEGMDDMEMPSPECYADNDPYLQTLAWCISTHCDGVSTSKLEEFWASNVVGSLANQPTPKYSYQKSLQLITEPPTSIISTDSTLDAPSLVDEEVYLSSYNGNHGFENMEVKSSRYGYSDLLNLHDLIASIDHIDRLVLLLTCTTIPIAFSWLRFLPLPPSVVSKFYAYVIDPPLFGSYHAVPVLGLGFVPTRGQALFIAYIWVINVVLSAVGYEIITPNSWYSTTSDQLLSFIANRVGVLSFVNLAITILYSSRNNVLLHLSSWSHSTFLLVHRWVAFICMLQACLHSVLYVRIYRQKDAADYAAERQLEYWIWGVIATLCLAIMIPSSVLWVRKRAYETFLASHIVLAVLGTIGCMLHIYYRFAWQWGYEVWVWIAFAVFIFDRFLARPWRSARNGRKTAFVSIVDNDYLKVDIPAVEAHGQAYLYFPTLTWRIWENHPFSVAALSGVQLPEPSLASETNSKSDTPLSGSPEAEKQITRTNTSLDKPRVAGITFYIRRMGGFTEKLAQHAKLGQGTTVLVESSYGPEQMSIVPSPTSQPTIDYPNLICIAGGVGITAVLPLLNRSDGSLAPFGKTKLFWGVRTEPLVASVENMLGQEGTRHDGKAKWRNVDVSISIGERFNLRTVLENEVRGAVGGTTVVVCGPPGMADEVRLAVTGLARHGAIVRLSEESFSW